MVQNMEEILRKKENFLNANLNFLKATVVLKRSFPNAIFAKLPEVSWLVSEKAFFVRNTLKAFNDLKNKQKSVRSNVS